MRGVKAIDTSGRHYKNPLQNLAGVLYRNEVGPNENKWDKVINVLDRCETRLTRYKYMASDHITVAGTDKSIYT